MKHIYPVFLLGLGLGYFTVAHGQTITDEHLHHFCQDKPIWSAFGIESKQCFKAASDCAERQEFADLDPVVLSEGFYQCVFKQLDIEA